MEGAARHGTTELVADPDPEAAARAPSSTAPAFVSGSPAAASSELGVTGHRNGHGRPWTRYELSLE